MFGSAAPSRATPQTLVSAQVLRAVSARDDGGAALAGGSDLVEALRSQGLVRTLLGMLTRLQPITTPGRQPREGDDARGTPVIAPSLSGTAACPPWPTIQPYEGYRSDLVSGESGGYNDTSRTL